MNTQNQLVANPFQKETAASQALVEVESSRAIQEVQAAMVIAKKFPRDESRAMDKLLQACTRPQLAEAAVYAYPRGGETVTGPSIRLAETAAQAWGNVQFGIRELSQANGESSVEAFAWDIENNIREVKVFTVPHVRHTRQGAKKLTDSRDIYELVANQGARRLRACILGILPGDFIDAAVDQCELTQQNTLGAPQEQIQALEEAFAAFGVTKAMLSKRVGKNLNAVIGADVLNLKRIYRSLKDGMATVDQFFDVSTGKKVEAGSAGTQGVKEKLQEAGQ